MKNSRKNNLYKPFGILKQIVRSWKHNSLVNIFSKFFGQKSHNKISMISLCELESSLENIKQQLENCLHSSSKNLISAEEIAEYYKELADIEGKSEEEIKKEAQPFYGKLRQFLQVTKQIKNNKRIDAEKLIEAVQLLGDIIENYWKYMPNSVKKALEFVYITSSSDSKSKSHSKNSSKVEYFAQVINQSAKLGRNLFAEIEQANQRLKNSLMVVLEEEKFNRLDIEEANLAEEEIQREGTTKWEEVKARFGIE